MAKKKKCNIDIDLSTIDDSGIEFATFDDEKSDQFSCCKSPNNICLEDKTDVVSSLPKKFVSQNTTPISNEKLTNTLQVLDSCLVD